MANMLPLLDAELRADGRGDGVFVDHDVHRLVSGVGFRHIPEAFVGTVVTPRVFHHEILLAVLVFCQTVDLHTVIVGRFPVVVGELAHLLRDGLFALAVGGVDLGTGLFARPARLVRTHTGRALRVGYGGHAAVFARAARETVLAHVGTPSKGVAIAYCAFHHFHEFVDGEVVARSPTPVVLYFDDESLVERHVSEGCQAHVVSRIKLEIVLNVRLRSVFLACYVESLRILSKIAIEHLLNSLLANGVDGLLVLVGRHALHESFETGPELTEVEETIAVGEVGVGHSAFGSETIVFHGVDNVIERTTL